MLYRLDIEEMEGRWIAYVPALPGCFASADSLGGVMGAAPKAIADYLAWEHTHGETIAAQDVDTELGEIIRAWNATPDYEVNAFFASDRPPLTQAELTHIQDLLDWSRADLLARVQGLAPEELARTVEADWSILRILQHVGRAELWYLDNLGFSLARDALPEDVFERLEKVRAHLREVLPSLAGLDRVVEKECELWSPRKMLRRALWHERDHTAHIRQFRRRLAPPAFFPPENA